MPENCRACFGMVERKTVEKVKKLVKNLGFKVNEAYLFGSRAKGNALKTSDVDVILVSEGFASMNWFERMTFAYRKWPFKESLEPLCYTLKEFEKKRSELGIVMDAVNTGVRVV